MPDEYTAGNADDNGATVTDGLLSHRRSRFSTSYQHELPATSRLSMFDDLRHASRMFARRSRFVFLLVATIGVGIGAATSIFSLVDVVLWKPLPYRDAARLYWIARTDESWRASPVLASVWDNLGHAFPNYREWSRVQRSFEATGAWFATTGVLAASDGVERISTARGTASLMPLLGVRPAIGRWFLPGEDDRSGPHVAVLSFETWQTRYGSDSSIVGKRLTLNALPFDVVGVLPRGFRIAGDTTLVEQHLRRDGICRRDPEAVEIGDRGLRGIVRNRGLQRAAREPELGESDDVGIRLDDEVSPRHTEVNDTVLDVLGNVARAHEQKVDRRIGAWNHEGALGGLEREPCVGAQPQGRLGHPALGRNGQGEAAVLAGPGERAHRRFARSSATR